MGKDTKSSFEARGWLAAAFLTIVLFWKADAQQRFTIVFELGRSASQLSQLFPSNAVSSSQLPSQELRWSDLLTLTELQKARIVNLLTSQLALISLLFVSIPIKFVFVSLLINWNESLLQSHVNLQLKFDSKSILHNFLTKQQWKGNWKMRCESCFGVGSPITEDVGCHQGLTTAQRITNLLPPLPLNCGTMQIFLIFIRTTKSWANNTIQKCQSWPF